MSAYIYRDAHGSDWSGQTILDLFAFYAHDEVT
jgi:hypothetical protein